MRVKQPEIIFEDDAVIVCRKEAVWRFRLPGPDRQIW